MNILVVVSVLLSLCSPGLAAGCYKHFEDFSMKEPHVCIVIDNITGSNGSSELYSPNRDDVTIKVQNSSSGIAEVKFPLASNSKYAWYRIQLYVLEKEITEEECRKVQLNKFELHSWQILDVFKCSQIQGRGEDCTPTCNRVGLVTFPYVFSGCYFVRMIPHKDTNEGRYVSSWPTVVHTEYRKQTIWSVKPIVHHQCFIDNQLVRINLIDDIFTDLPLIVKMMSGINMSRGDAACTRSGHEQSCCAVDPAISGSLECLPRSGSSLQPNNCSLLNDRTLECTFTNIQPGNYCVTFDPQDNIRCPKGKSVWTVMNGAFKNCISSYKFNCTVRPTDGTVAPLSVENNKDGIFISVGAILSVCIVGAVAYLLARKHIKHQPVPLPMDPVPTTVQTSHPKVLLLYAHDCKEFMQLMRTFRQLLVNVGGCEVYDCFDPDREEEIAKSPVEWMCHRASSPDVKVVVIASDCAVAHQKALSRGIILQYREPIPFDHLFRYGLKEVTYNHKKGEYTNTFVVRFDEKDLSYLTPYTRYVLPLHLPELLKSLNPSLDISTVGEYKDEKKLRDHHTEMMQFKRQNPTYFVQLMTKSGDVVCA